MSDRLNSLFIRDEDASRYLRAVLADFPKPCDDDDEQAGDELSKLVNAVTLFVENYRLIHAGTLYSLRVEEAARLVRAKMLEL